MTDEKAKTLVKALYPDTYDERFHGLMHMKLNGDELEAFAQYIESEVLKDQPKELAAIPDPVLNDVRFMLRFMFIDRQHTELLNTLRMYKNELKENKYNTRVQSNIKRVEHDLNLLGGIVANYGVPIARTFEKEFGVKFHFLGDDPAQAPPKPAIVTPGQAASEIDSTQQPPPMKIE